MTMKCTPLCPFRAFICTKRALSIRRYGTKIVSYCSWTGDNCIGYRCQFALCSRHALLPDGTCGLTVRRKRPSGPSIEEEAFKMEKEYKTLKNKLKKPGTEIEWLE